MTASAERRQQDWRDAMLAAALFAMAPAKLGGVMVRGTAGPVRDRWLAHVRSMMAPGAPLQRVPINVSADRLQGGLDVAATLAAGQRRVERGVLAQADGGAIVLPMAERWSASAFGPIAAAMDVGAVRLERDGLQAVQPACFGVIALVEDATDDEQPPAALTDRLAFVIDVSALSHRDCSEVPDTACEIAEGRGRYGLVAVPDADIIQALCTAALALGVASLRAVMLAVEAARAHAAMAGRTSITSEDAQAAARLVLAPRATQVPVAPEEAENQDQAQDQTGAGEAPEPADATGEDTPETDSISAAQLEDLLIEAAVTALPPGLLAAAPERGLGGQGSSKQSRQTGTMRKSTKRGRPIGVQSTRAATGNRLNMAATLLAAAPWQRLRGADRSADLSALGQRLRVMPDDFRVTRYKARAESITIFAVDASGSLALNRLAEAKGAVELLLADCYVRRDKVALIAFRGRSAELLLPPTRSLARAKRCLSMLPGGGGTPLANAIDSAGQLAQSVTRGGTAVMVVLLTDGHANMTRAGEPDRAKAETEALEAARQMQTQGVTALLVDTSPRPQPKAQALSAALGARYVPLPHANAVSMARVISGVAAEGRR